MSPRFVSDDDDEPICCTECDEPDEELDEEWLCVHCAREARANARAERELRAWHRGAVR